MTLKFGFLTIGEAGANVGEYAAQRGLPVVTANGALIDLEKLRIIPKDCRVYLEGWEGAGRNRDVGRKAMISYADLILEKARDKLAGCDMIFVVAASGGGTGSGGVPIGLEIASEVNDRIGAIIILPDDNESPKARMNALECFSELSEFKQLGSLFVIDNERAKRVFTGDRVDVYDLSNRQVIDNLMEVVYLTRQRSLISNFDENDLLEIISERGYSIVSKAVIPVENAKRSIDIVMAIRESWGQTCSPDIGSGQIVKAAVLGRIPREVIPLIDLEMIFNETGIPYDVIEAYYPNNEHQNTCIFYTLLSGLSFPLERLNQIERTIKDIEQDLIDRVETARTQSFKSDDWGSRFKRKINKADKPSLTERLARFK